MAKTTWICAATMALGLASVGMAQRPVAATPPMGWNSWDAYGLTITEPQFRANATVEKEKLLAYGWRYAVIDEGWFLENPEDRPKPETLRYSIDSHGRYVPVPKRFPSAVAGAAAGREERTGKYLATIQETGFVELGRWVHAQGLLFGIHIVRGIPRAAVERNLPIDGSGFTAREAADESDACPWDPTNWGLKDTPAGQAWYDSLLRQYAAWGVDLLKVDCIASHPYKVDEIRMIRRAMTKAGRPMVLSLSPGPTSLDNAAEVGQLANMWRISDDEWDVWDSKGQKFPQGVKDQFARVAAWEQYAKAGNWPDADMLPIGELRPEPGWGKARSTRLTAEEQRTQMTLWAMARSPLILGANLTLLDDATLRLMTNRDVIAIDQTGTKNREVLHDGDLIAWRASLPGGKFALAIFNTGDTAMKLDRKLAEFDGAWGSKEWLLRDVWAGQELGRRGTVTADVAPHACLLLMLR